MGLDTRLLGRVLAGTIALATGCDPEATGPALADLRCAQAYQRSLDRIVPSVELDYLSIRSDRVLAARGQPCLGAQSSACMETLAQKRTTAAYYQFVGTREDKVFVWRTALEIGALLEPIDTPAEAVWIARANARGIDPCTAHTSETAPGGYKLTIGYSEPHLLFVSASGQVRDVIPPQPPKARADGVVEGRRPMGLWRCSSGTPCSAGEHFARAAQDEAASIAAFQELAVELQRLQAPRALVHGALRAAREELRHARMVGALARRYGAEPQPAVVEAQPACGLFALALHNAVEGCINESYSAFRTVHQALASTDPVVRAAMASIARDELRHAAWSWDLAAWAEPRLSPAERDAIARARSAAREQLLETPADVSPEVARIAGLPEPAQARLLASALPA